VARIMTVRLDKKGPVARLLIDRPAKRNAMTQAMWETLPNLVGQAMADEAVRVLVLQSSSPGIFCAGADIGEFAKHSGSDAWLTGNQAGIRASQYALAHAPKPVIAAIDGDCIGGGCGLAIACDIRIASARSRLAITPAKLGLVYGLFDTKLVVDLVGPAQAKRILFTAGMLSGTEALRIGLIDVLDDEPNVVAMNMAQNIATNAQHSVRAAKSTVRRILDGQADDDADTLAMFREAFDRPDFIEGVAAFHEKRKPVF
jgi:enoyl-CoA hydratase/carnithine racemase